MTYLIESRKIVIPGELLAEGDYRAGRHTYQEDKKIYASIVGLSNHVGRNVYVVALKGCYFPQIGDLVIGKIIDMRLGSWIADINAPYTANLFASDVFDRPFNSRKEDMTRVFNIGDLVLAKVKSFDRTRDPSLTTRESGLGRIVHGRIITMTPTKIPRLIGRRGSMINSIKRETGTNITIGQNGLILISGKRLAYENLAIKVIHLIEAEAHTSGLTERVTKFIKEEKSVLNDKN